MTALAVMAALIGAMFVAMTSIGAQAADPKVGDIAVPAGGSATSSPAGFCVDPDPTDDTDQPVVRTTQVASGTALQVYAPDDTVDTDTATDGVQGDAGTALDLIDIKCDAEDHEKRVSVTPNGTTSPIVTVSDPNALLLLGRNIIDNTKTREVSLRLLVLNFLTNDKIVDAEPGGDPAAAGSLSAASAEVDWIRVSGVLDGIEDFDLATADNQNLSVTWLSAPTGFADMDLTQKIVVPKGTPEGEYTITARIIFDRAGEDNEATTEDEENAVLGSENDPDEEIIAEATLTIGDAGDAIGSVELSLGNEKEDNPHTTASELKEEKGVTEAKGGAIWLKLTTMNSLGAPTNGGDVQSVTVLGPGGDFEVYKAGKYASGKVVDHEGNTRSDAGSSLDSDDNSVGVDDPGASTLFIKVEKADQKPGTVEVEAVVVGGGNKAESNTFTLIFGGPAKSLELGDAKPVAPGDKTEFSVVANDDGGNEATISRLTFQVTDADGKSVSGTNVFVEQGKVGDSTTDTTLDDDPNTDAAIVTIGGKAEPGIYTITVSLAGVSSSKTTTTVTVAGSPENVALTADPETGDADELTLIKVTASVTDKNGAPAVDGTLVEFSVLGTSLSAAGPGHAPIMTTTSKQLVNVADPDESPKFEERTLTTTSGGAKVKDGEVSVSFIATGAGTAVVTATTEGGSASNSIRITTTDSGSADAMADAGPSLGHLSGTSGLVSYSGPDATASELMALLAGRASSIWLSVNGSWVLYANVDGAMVPGSSDFTVTSGDVLYISN